MNRRQHRVYTTRRSTANDVTVALLKKQAKEELDAGDREVILDVRGLPARDRNRLRMYTNRWLRQNGWRGSTHFDPDKWTLTVRVLQQIHVADTEEE